MAVLRCPTCSKPFDQQASRWMPFCSERCQRVDLNRWLNEEISLPYRETPDDAQSDRFRDEDDDDF